MESKTGVYAITCYGNGKFYIGSSVNVSARRNSHFSQLRKRKHQNKHLQNAYNKYGEDSFYFDVVEYCTKEDVLTVEQKWLNFLEPHCKPWGMNNSPTACNKSGFRHSEETKKELSRLAKLRDNNHLKEHAEAMRGKPSINRGKKLRKWTDAEKEAAGKQRKGRVPWNKGIPQSIETIAKIKAYVPLSKYTEDQKKNCIDLRHTGKSLNEISITMNIPISTVYRFLRTYEKKNGVTK